MGKDITLVVMAAGMGSRFGGLKQLEPIGKNGEVILDFSVYDAVKAGFNKVVFVIKHAIEDDFKRIVGSRIEKKVKVEYVFQETDALPEGFTCPADRQKPWGTAHAILCCKNVVKEPFAVVNADDYYGRSAFKKIYDELSSASEDYCMVGFRLKNTLTENGTVSRGVCVTDNNALESVTEYTKIRSDCSFTEDDGKTWNALSPDTVVSMNLWGFRPDVFKYIEKCGLQFDFIFADPPYALKELATIPDLIFQYNLLKPEGIFVLEHGKNLNFESHPCFFEHRHYGSVNFSFFKVKEQTDEQPTL